MPSLLTKNTASWVGEAELMSTRRALQGTLKWPKFLLFLSFLWGENHWGEKNVPDEELYLGFTEKHTLLIKYELFERFIRV